MNPVRGQSTLGSCLVCLLWFAAIVAQEKSPDKTTPDSKKTASGVEVTILEAKPAEEFDAVNRVPMFRMGSCPPGAAMPGIKIGGNRGKDVIIVQLGLKFPPDYPQSDFPIPVLLDASGKKYPSNNVMAPSKELVPRIKTTGEQLKCEVPFEVPAGTEMTKLQYDTLVFDLKLKSRSEK